MFKYCILYDWIIQECHLITGLFRQKDWDLLWSGRDSLMREVVIVCFMHAFPDHVTTVLAIAIYFTYDASFSIRWYPHERGKLRNKL